MKNKDRLKWLIAETIVWVVFACVISWIFWGFKMDDVKNAAHQGIQHAVCATETYGTIVYGFEIDNHGDIKNFGFQVFEETASDEIVSGKNIICNKL